MAVTTAWAVSSARRECGMLVFALTTAKMALTGMHEAFGEKVHVVEGTFENGQTKALMWFCEEVDSCSRSSRPVLPVASRTV